MTVTIDFFRRPRLREGVSIEPREATCLVRYRDEEYEIELAAETRDASVRLLGLLRDGGRSLDELAREVPALARELGTVCRDLDRFGLLDETSFAPTEAKPGAQFYRELVRFTDRVKLRCNRRPYYEGLTRGELTREQLVGYALEYYHVVRMCPGLLAPALSHHEGRRTRQIIQDFFTSELDHDLLLERSLAAIGISRAQLDRLVPLPATFAVCSSLGVYARLHPMSFKASLFLFEEPDGDFNAAFKPRCEALGLPAEFYGPIFEHASVNEQGGHDCVGELLFAEVTGVSDEEQHIVKRHIGVLIESLVLMERQILDYYGGPRGPVPRCFD
jgi:TENA/THI-4/PQQC family